MLRTVQSGMVAAAFSLALGSIAAGGVAPAPADAAPPRPLPGPVINRVLDLFDGELALGEDESWQSEIFAVGEFTRVGVRTSGTASANAVMACSLAWRFAPEDAFRVSGPTARVGTDATFLASPIMETGFGAVRGLHARVVCRPSPSEVFLPDPAPVSGVLTDVKVLLRHQ